MIGDGNCSKAPPKAHTNDMEAVRVLAIWTSAFPSVGTLQIVKQVRDNLHMWLYQIHDYPRVQKPVMCHEEADLQHPGRRAKQREGASPLLREIQRSFLNIMELTRSIRAQGMLMS